MTIGQFYCRASFLPLLVPAAAGIIVGLLWLTASQQTLDSGSVRALAAVAVTGIFSTLPYAVYLIVLASKSRREGWEPGRIRRWVWMGPAVLAIVVATALSLRDFLAYEWESGFAGATFVGFWTLLIGYAYVALIEAARVIAQLAGLLQPDAPKQGAQGITTKPVDAK